MIHSTWLGANDLDRACGNDSYLQYPQVQQVLVSGNGQNENFDNLDLQGANLTGVRLTGAYLQNYIITPTTLLEAIECDYIYTQLPSEELGRQPANPNQIFKPGELDRFLNRNII